MSPDVSAVIAAAGAIVVSYFGYVINRGRLRQDRAMQLVDQHQEDLIELRKEVATLRAEAVTRESEQRARDAHYERVQRIQGDYVGQLRRHISDGRPPPPPPWPEGLIT